MAASPIFVGTPKFVNRVLNATNAGDSSYQNPTTISTILTMVAAGRIDTVKWASLGTNDSTSVRVFIDTVGTGGTNNILIYDGQLPATSSASVTALASTQWNPSLVLPANAVLRATVANTAVTNGVSISVEYGEF